MRFNLLAAAAATALLAGCASGPYYGTYSSGYDYGYAPGYYAYDYGYAPYYYYDYGPAYYGPGLAFSYRSGDGHWNGSHYWNGTTHSWNGTTHSWNGTRSSRSSTIQTQPRTSSRAYARAHPNTRSLPHPGTARDRTNDARNDRIERQQRSRVASAPHGPDREHGGG
jgi:hypothetical protein